VALIRREQGIEPTAPGPLSSGGTGPWWPWPLTRTT